MQAAQAPVGKQIGADAAQSELPPQARQVWLPRSQTGVVPLHWALETQATQTLAVVSQTGVAPLQRVLLVAEQTPQAPDGWQAGFMPPHSLSPAQPRHVCVVPSQIGARALPQSASARQATQVPAATSHIGVAPAQALELVAEHWPQAPDVSQAGVAPPHSPSPAQARQPWVARLQTGAVPPHWAFDVQPTQVPEDTSQAGVAPPQAPRLLLEHWPQAPVGSQAGVAPPQSPSREQPRQTWLAASQIGVVPEHWALLTHETQVPEPELQYGVLPVHNAVLLAEHWPHEPEGWQAGVEPPHSVSPPQPRQVCRVASQTGAVGLPQSAFARHETQVPFDTRQIGVGPVQAVLLVAEHWPQAPEPWQAGVAPPHSVSPEQARQVCVAVLQTGLVPPHCALLMQLTQVPVGTSQAGVVPVHLLVFVAEQIPQAPDGWQAGVAPLQSASPAQARQVCVPPSQTGVDPEQSALARQRTHFPTELSQTGVAPVHSVLLLAEHWPQAPEPWQAGVAPPHSPSPVHARQVWKARSHTGVVPEQSALARQRTQVPDGV
jgi:hypothetical protein